MGDDAVLTSEYLKLEQEKVALEKRRLEWMMEHETKRLELDQFDAQTRRILAEKSNG